MKLDVILKAAEKALRDGAVLVTAADLCDGGLARVQLYFWSEHQAVMDVVEKRDLVENWPDEGVFVMNLKAASAEESLTPVRIVDGEEDFYIRAVPGEENADDLGVLPSVDFMSAVEAISTLKDKIRL